MLERIGYDAATAVAVAAWVAADALPGRVLRVDEGVCTVLTEEGALRVTLGGDLLRRVAADATLPPRPGDWCLVRRWPDGPLTLERLLPRRTTVCGDGLAWTGGTTAVAANVDLVATILDVDEAPAGPGRRRRRTCRLSVLVTPAGPASWRPGGPAPTGTIQVDLTTGAGLAELTALLQGRLTLAVGCSRPLGLSARPCRSAVLVQALVGARGLGTRRAGGELLVLPTGGAVIDVGPGSEPRVEASRVGRPGAS